MNQRAIEITVLNIREIKRHDRVSRQNVHLLNIPEQEERENGAEAVER